tara:strand:- start:7714 stop:9423 length:1710 start_codon:yes stop_codon:yes gene_type:complete
MKSTIQEKAWKELMSAELHQALVSGGSKRKRSLMAVVTNMLLFFAILGAAGPTWEKRPQPVEKQSDALVIILDLSLSMMAEDIKPSRIIRAKQKIIDILRYRKEGSTALVAYAGDAHTVAPLTDDSGTIENLLSSLEPSMMPVLGSAPAHAMEIATELIKNSALTQGRILFLTDGVTEVEQLAKMAGPAIPLSIIGFGSDSGAPIPLTSDRQKRRLLKDNLGKPIITKINEDALKNLAQAGYGAYSRVSYDDSDFKGVLAESFVNDIEAIDAERDFDTWHDQGYWIALLLVPFVLFAFRKGVLISFAGFLLTLQFNDTLAGVANSQNEILSNTEANLWSRLWFRDDQLAFELLEKGDAKTAAHLFQDEKWKSVANYRNKEWGPALNGFSSDLSADGLYNQGNSLAQLGSLNEAIEKYDRALELNPEDDDARFNRDLVKELLQKQQEQQKEKTKDNEGQQSESPDQKDQSDQDDGEKADDPSADAPYEENRQQQNEGDNPEETDKGQSEGKSNEDEQLALNEEEQKQALEQWLRRVPDNPGGLLKRKFRYETEQRLRKGDYRYRQGEEPW